MNTHRIMALTGAILACATAICGCGGGGSASSPQVTSRANLPPAVAADLRSAPPVPSAIVTANNNFGFQLLAQMRTTDAGKNVFISPTSVAIAMEILYNGAAGGTQTAMAGALDLGSISLGDLNSGNAALQASLINADPTVQLSIANSFWYRKATHQILQSFIDTNTQYYGSQLGDLAGAPSNINAWVSAQTNGNITNVVGQEVSNYVAMLVNAVYFKGNWTSQFDPSRTTPSTFTLADGVTTVTCTMMTQDTPLPYYQGDSFQAVKLAYGNQRLAMVVFLPDSGVSIGSLLKEITAQNLNLWLPQFVTEFGTVQMPKFTSSYTSNLKPVLTALGMGVAFDPNSANFANMGPALFLDTAVHKTYLAVNEVGTVAAGATSIGVGATDAPVDKFKLTLNRPFVCAIMDQKSGEILFYGAIDNPAI